MANIYNFLSSVWQKEKKELCNNPFVGLVSLVLITIPLPYIFNSISVIVLVVFSLYNLKFNKFQMSKNQSLLIGLYLLMVVSLLWTINFKESFSALTKEIPFLFLPICFAIIPKFSTNDITKVMRYFSYGFVGFTVFYLLKALFRFAITKEVNVFFYHELVTFDVNAIHVSVYISIAFFYFYLKTNKSNLDKLSLLLLFTLLVLLSSKNILIVFLILVLFASYYVLKIKLNQKSLTIIFGAILLIGIAFFGKIKDRFLIEIESNRVENSINNEISGQNGIVYNVSVKDAWNKETFQYNDFFPGLALRVYQARIFTEMVSEENIFFTGYGLNAVKQKIEAKRVEHNLYPGYDKYNFHNQYIQLFAELGIFGLLLLLLILINNLKNAIKSKDFIHFSFAILMISLFLTESFLSRQRGIVFFTTMYCLFNSGIVKPISNKK